MAGPASPNEGPTFEPPQLPPGWIAQWDGASKKYYYVQLSTGVSQWETPTQAAPGNTPAQVNEHPYGIPGQQEVITHPDGTQTVKHPDGRMEPVLAPDGSRGLDGPSGERGFGSFATNTLLSQFSGGHGKPQSGSSHGSSGIGGIASQLIGGLGGSHGSSHGSSSGGHGGGVPSQLVGQLASGLFSSGSKPQQPQNYHAGQSHQPQHSSGLAGSVMGGVASMFGGAHQPGQNYGYSNSGHTGGYSGQAPPTSYQSPSASTPSYSAPPHQQSSPSYNPPSGHHGTQQYPPPPGQHAATSYPPPPGQTGGHQHPSFHSPPPGSQHQNPPYGGAPSSVHSGYGHSPTPQANAYSQQPQYTSPPPNQPQYNGHQQYPPPPSTYGNRPYNVSPPSSGPHGYSGQPSYANAGPPVPSATHPHAQSGYPGNW
ncbi:hypothetical protein F5Y00DRAFT_205104 [Daldinia vernicosa]|uniref:uncharacterized protein n=1 Tax=Daldinia vernicosa TaxID=114800 RepID=UPI002007E017|nr:uncharacterized protein F5Y00DRAFT_205104 [Daldinia vernicosa]KAI0852008.1 hypothetical protein F5Y00DRAFT_205104 [Daldinia vernicosa]